MDKVLLLRVNGYRLNICLVDKDDIGIGIGIGIGNGIGIGGKTLTAWLPLSISSSLHILLNLSQSTAYDLNIFL